MQPPPKVKAFVYLRVKPGDHYDVANLISERAQENLAVRRVGDDLVLESESEDVCVQLVDFFAQNMLNDPPSATANVAGSLIPTVITPLAAPLNSLFLGQTGGLEVGQSLRLESQQTNQATWDKSQGVPATKLDEVAT